MYWRNTKWEVALMLHLLFKQIYSDQLSARHETSSYSSDSCTSHYPLPLTPLNSHRRIWRWALSVMVHQCGPTLVFTESFWAHVFVTLPTHEAVYWELETLIGYYGTEDYWLNSKHRLTALTFKQMSKWNHKTQTEIIRYWLKIVIRGVTSHSTGHIINSWDHHLLQ